MQNTDFHEVVFDMVSNRIKYFPSSQGESSDWIAAISLESISGERCNCSPNFRNRPLPGLPRSCRAGILPMHARAGCNPPERTFRLPKPLSGNNPHASEAFPRDSRGAAAGHPDRRVRKRFPHMRSSLSEIEIRQAGRSGFFFFCSNKEGRCRCPSPKNARNREFAAISDQRTTAL